MQIYNYVKLLPLLCLFVVGCGQQNSFSSSATPPQTNLTISAATSLKESMTDIQKIYQQEKPNVNITYNFGSAGALQQQIQQGVPVDVFISAASKQVDALQKQGLLLDDSRKNLLQNKVVLIVPKTATNISNFQDLLKADVKKVALGEPGSVPVGKYAEETLNFLGISQLIKQKAVFAKDVRQVVTYVETGNVDAGIVYETEAKQSDKVKIVATAPENSHSPIIYPVAVLKNSKDAAAAKEFVEFLRSEKAGNVFKKYGFILVKKSPKSSTFY
jgi:molybdate transport system substrate-binding protein